MISLCIISRKEDQEALQQSLKGIGDYVDEVIVVDTTKNGSIEKGWTTYVTHANGSLEHPILTEAKIVPFEWINDFSAARNFSFAQATHDVIFWIDSDDTVLHPEKLPELAKEIEEGRADWIDLEYVYAKDDQGNVTLRQWKPRLIRKGSGHWEKTIHENFVPDHAIDQIRSNLVVIDHNLTEEHSAESAQRNLSFLLDEYEKDGDKTDPRTLYYIANTLTEMRKFEEAIPFFTKHIKQCGWPEEKYFSTHFLAQCLHLLGRTDEAITVALSATKIIPKWSLAYFDLAQFYSDTGQSANVIEWTLTGLAKEQPQPQDYFINDLDYTLFPMGRLADAYMQTGEFEEAYKIAARLRKEYPKDPRVEELYKTSKIVNADENFVKSFITVALRVRSTDRIKATKLFEALPMDLDGDIRLQQVRTLCLPPKTWDDNSIVIFCGKGNGEEWSPASVHTGIGGSEEAVIHMSQELTKLGYKVTVYNSCGTQRGMYKGVEYLPYYFFSEKDIYNTVIAWRNPGLMGLDFKAKKKIVWLHDIAYPQQFSPESIENTDTFIFLSKWHRNNVPEIPEEKCFISNNGIDLSQFKDIDIKAKKGLFWGSSYDRGLLCLVRDIMPLIHKELPDVTLDVCYGWDNIDRELSFIPSLAALRQELTPLLEQDYITHHGRVGHQQVADLMKKAQVMPYSSEFGETNMITSQKAQAAQTWVVMPEDAGGAPERVKYGAVIPRGSIYTDKETQKLFAEEVIRVLRADTFGDFDASEFSWTETAKTWQEIL